LGTLLKLIIILLHAVHECPAGRTAAIARHVSFSQITYTLNDKQCTVRVFDRPKLFMPQRLNDCLGMGMGRNGKSLVGIPWEWELIRKLESGMGKNGK